MRHHDQLKLGTTTTLDEPVLETLVSDDWYSASDLY